MPRTFRWSEARRAWVSGRFTVTETQRCALSPALLACVRWRWVA